jgi:hypothetical protein
MPDRIDFYPSIRKLEKIFVGAIDWCVNSTMEINKLEADLTPFMNTAKEPSFHVSVDDPWVVNAKHDVEHRLDRYLEYPKKILA